MFRHPKYYKELRKRNKLDQAISNAEATAASERATGPGHKQRDSQVVNQVKLSSQSQASSSKPQATEIQAASDKRQAPSSKLQAPSHKLQAPRSENHGKVSRPLNQGAQCR